VLKAFYHYLNLVIMLYKSITSLLFVCLLSSTLAFGQEEKKSLFSLVFGLNQPILLRGFNIEGNYWSKKWVVDYSHGFNLHADGKFVSDTYESQKINFKITHSLGFGFGYRFTEALNVRFEPKLHVYQTYYEGAEQVKSNSLVNFNTYTLGLGLYYRWLPFAQKQGFIKGITLVPSLRYWHKVGSSLENDAFSYNNKLTNRTESFKTPNIGLANTPWIFNISVGYSF
jgi:hypothetical protein